MAALREYASQVPVDQIADIATKISSAFPEGGVKAAQTIGQNNPVGAAIVAGINNPQPPAASVARASASAEPNVPNVNNAAKVALSVPGGFDQVTATPRISPEIDMTRPARSGGDIIRQINQVTGMPAPDNSIQAGKNAVLNNVNAGIRVDRALDETGLTPPPVRPAPNNPLAGIPAYVQEFRRGAMERARDLPAGPQVTTSTSKLPGMGGSTTRFAPGSQAASTPSQTFDNLFNFDSRDFGQPVPDYYNGGAANSAAATISPKPKGISPSTALSMIPTKAWKPTTQLTDYVPNTIPTSPYTGPSSDEMDFPTVGDPLTVPAQVPSASPAPAMHPTVEMLGGILAPQPVPAPAPVRAPLPNSVLFAGRGGAAPASGGTVPFRNITTRSGSTIRDYSDSIPSVGRASDRSTTTEQKKAKQQATLKALRSDRDSGGRGGIRSGSGRVSFSPRSRADRDRNRSGSARY